MNRNLSFILGLITFFSANVSIANKLTIEPKLFNQYETREITEGSYSKFGLTEEFDFNQHNNLNFDTTIYSIICKYHGKEFYRYSIGIIDEKDGKFYHFNTIGDLDKILELSGKEFRNFDSELPECPKII